MNSTAYTERLEQRGAITLGSNMTFSAVVHVIMIMAAAALASWNASSRVPEKYVVVTLIGHEAPMQEVPGEKKVNAGKSSQNLKKKRLRGPGDASSPAQDAKESTPAPLPEKRSLFQAGSDPAKDDQVEVKGAVQGDRGRESHGASSGTVHAVVHGSKPEKDGQGAGKEGAAENRTWAVSAIRDAIERAKIYPALARRRNQEGTVVTEFSINAKGLPEDVRVTRSSGFSLIDNAARDTVYRAAPFPVVKGSIEVPITFILK